MRKEYGGYLPLELSEGNEPFDRYVGAKVARFNSGRAAIVAAALAVKPRMLHIPRYNCAVVREALEMYRIPYALYDLDGELRPKLDGIMPDEWMMYVNYFGTLPEARMADIARQYENVIFDHTQAFFARPILDGNCMNAYSPRKFVGVVDGGYLVWSGEREVSEDYPLDVSWNRASYLFKSIELGTNAAYQDNLESKVCLADGIKRMSVLTRRMMQSIDYDKVAAQRERNYRVLIEKFKGINQLKLPMEGYAPFIYPLVVQVPGLRRALIDRGIYVSQWWKYLLEEVLEGSVEAWLSQWLLPLPIDQRYTEQDMEAMANMILSIIGRVKTEKETCENEPESECGRKETAVDRRPGERDRHD